MTDFQISSENQLIFNKNEDIWFGTTKRHFYSTGKKNNNFES